MVRGDGVVVHWNDLSIWRNLQKKMIPPMTYDSFKEGYSPESTRIDRWLYQNIDDADEIMELLERSHETDFEDYLKAACITKMKRHLIDVQYNLPDPIDISGHKFYKADTGDRWTRDENGEKIHVNLKNYGVETEIESTWFIDGIKKYHRMFSTIVNTLIEEGFTIDKIVEPLPDEELLKKFPEHKDLFHKPDFLVIKTKKR